MKYDTQTIEKLQPTPPQSCSAQGVELQGVLKLRERKTGRRVTRPGEIFACLMAMGYQRDGEKLPMQQRAKQFVEKVRDLLVMTNRRSPSYDELLRVMTQLGYTRTLATIGPDARSAAQARQQWESAN